MTKVIFKEWDTKYKNDLPDSSFAYISPGGTKDDEGKTTPRSLRHLPYKDADGKPDLPHVRNALARLEHTDIPEDKKPGIEKKLKAILDKSKASEKCVGMLPFEFKEGEADADGKGKLPDSVHLVPIGAWDHDLYGDIVIKASDILEFVQNFDAEIRKGVFITAGHEGFSELPAVGWVDSVEAKEDGLWGVVKWNELGKEALTDKQFKFFSPEFYPTYEDPQSHIIYHNVLTGGALTKSPYFKELEALVMSDKIIQSNFKETNTMDMATLLAKKKSDLNQEEKDHLKKNKSKLTDKQLKEYADVIGDPDEDEDEDEDEDTEEAKKKKASEDAAAADEAAKKAAENEAAGLNADGTEKVNASEKVMITAGELALLRSQADKGALAFKELEATKLTAEVSKLVFSATNKAGAFLPKEEADLKKFMESLNANQRTQFSTLISKVRTSVGELFTEKGADTKVADGTAMAELNAKIEVKMKADDKLKYSDALKMVMSENKGLEERYDGELPASRRGKE